MRTVLMTALLSLALSNAASAQAIAPGMTFEAAKKTLQDYGYEVDALKYGLAIASHDRNIALDFCRIDADVTLVLGYDRRTKKVTALSLYFIPDHRTSKTQVVVRDAIEMRFEEGGVYTLKLRRKAGEATMAD